MGSLSFSSSLSLFRFSLNELRTGQYDRAVLTLLINFCQLLKLRRKINIAYPIETPGISLTLIFVNLGNKS